MLGAIESLLSAVVADRMGGGRHNPNTELFAQGIANIVSPLFGGLPATGAIARTATNIRAGGRTPVAGMVHAFTLLAILMFGTSLAAYVPLPVLADLTVAVEVGMVLAALLFHLGDDNICDSVQTALVRAAAIMERAPRADAEGAPMRN